MHRAADLLADLAGPDATFRPHQFEAVRDLVEDRARVLCVHASLDLGGSIQGGPVSATISARRERAR